MSNVQVMYVGNDMIIEVENLKNDLTNAFVNDAVVLLTLKQTDGVVVAGGSWPMPMSFVPGSDGSYRAVLGSDLPLVAGKEYMAGITADAGAGLRAAWAVPCVARNRS